MGATLEAFADQVFSSGERESATYDIDDADDRITLRVARAGLSALPDTEIASAELWVSVDGGPFAMRGHVGFAGGDCVTQAGPATETVATWWLPGKGTGRRVRVRFVCSRALRASVAIDTAGDGANLAPRMGQQPRSVAIDSSGFVAESLAASSLSGSITVANQPDRLLFGSVASNMFADDPRTITAFTFNGDTLTEVHHQTVTDNVQSDVWKRVAPAVATGTLSVTFDATTDHCVLGYIALYNAGTVGTPGTGTGTNTASATCSGAEVGGMAVAWGVFAGSSNPMTVAVTDGTPQWEKERQNTATAVATEDGAASNTLAFSGTGGSIFGGAIAIGVAVAVSAAVYVPYPDAWNSVGWMEAPWMAGKADSRSLVLSPDWVQDMMLLGV